MNLKSLATGVATAVGAVAVVGAAAAGVTSIASVTTVTSPAIQPVVWDIPLPQTPAPDLQAPLTQTLNALATGGSFSGAKSAYIEGGVGRIEAITADRAFSNAQAKGLFPLTFGVADIDVNGPVATANVTATAANGVSTTRPVTFIAGPSPSGWLVQKGSALSLLASAG
ncbi:hypothetical protein BVC93_23860 [Mycobacterium sp. MS1601]|uniref:hypothetical protein n=1 Tax=Mycobacterium sp. MS1601 TaxID=1936029 RepID=UPI0009797115|nr:hypothetical protein [Mycobacterium sp. MS1601]AQA04941.1 hypothetical protein BVC93_23860 [Mycobacterium sp. MS1601]